jgi:hypothetical protein
MTSMSRLHGAEVAIETGQGRCSARLYRQFCCVSTSVCAPRIWTWGGDLQFIMVSFSLTRMKEDLESRLKAIDTGHAKHSSLFSEEARLWGRG